MISVVIERAGQVDQAFFDKPEITIGRNGGDISVDLDLSHDNTVSRLHARVIHRDGLLFVEDLGSRAGTWINGKKISAVEQVLETDQVQLGENTIRFLYKSDSTRMPRKNSEGIVVASYYLYRGKQYKRTTSLENAPDQAYSELEGKNPNVVGRIEVSDEVVLDEIFSSEEDFKGLTKAYLNLLLDAPRRFSVQVDLNRQLIEIVGRLVEEMDGVERSAVLLLDESSGFLNLRAHFPENEPAVSGTLAIRALDEKKGFIWQKSSLDEASESIRTMRINSGMYAPIICGDKSLGVLCVDSTRKDHVFKRFDLHFFLAFTQIIAACVQSKIIHETIALNLQGMKEALKEAQRSAEADKPELLRTIEKYLEFLQSKI